MNQKVILLFMCLFAVSCLEAPQNGRLPSSTEGSDGLTGGGGTGNGNGAIGGGNAAVSEEESIPKVELRHLIEPKVDNISDSGSYKRKLTIPKNYDSFLYVAGINVQTLADKNLKVRFNFGLNSAPIIVQATLASATPNGLTSSSPVQVLALDLRSKPFNDIQLIYDLYDYNDYDYDGSGNNPGALAEPVSFNRNDGLFCRGLALKDDPTFPGNSSNKCEGTNDICKYTFAKVLDKGLVEEDADDPSLLLPIVPNERQIQSGAVGLYSDSDSLKIQRCLPDDPFAGSFAYRYDNSISFLSFFDDDTIGGKKYLYYGPYKTSSFEQWQIKSQAITGKYGLFGEVFDVIPNNEVDDVEIEFGYRSKLFPLYVQYELPRSTEYLGSVLPDGEKILMETNANGVSEWMDGCNARATTVHNITGEHIGSCTVTATIELIAEDDDDNSTVVDITNEIKLQLVKPSLLDTNGVDVLADSFSQCSSTSQCGSGSCCINNRCWSRDIVQQCIEDLPSFGNQITGESCSSDYQCSSLCCNKVDGRCAPHDTTSDNPSFCSKPSGQSCVAKEWCAKSPITTCAVVNTGRDQFGGITCAKRCITVEAFGECTSSNGIDQGICIPPTQPPTIIFDETDPNRCLEAISFSELEECANNPDQCTL